jgi:hypothetical protein
MEGQDTRKNVEGRHIKTLEGRENIKGMLEATASQARPDRWQAEGDATSDNGVI